MSNTAIVTQQDWRSFLAKRSHSSFLQSWEWGELNKKEGRDVVRLVTGFLGAQIIRYPLPFGKSYIYAPRGPVGDIEHTADLQAFVSAAKAWAGPSALFLRVDPPADTKQTLYDVGFTTAPENAMHSAVTNPPSIALLDIARSEEDILAGFKSKTRYNVRLAKRRGVTTTIVDASEALSPFLKLLRKTAERAGFSLHSDEHYRAIVDVFGDSIFFVEARHDGDLLASLMILYWKTTATYLFGGSSRKKSEHMGPYAAHWRAIREAKKRDCTRYDFGAIAPRGEDDDDWGGMTRFKMGFGTEEKHYGRPFDAVYSRPWYWAYNTARRLQGQ